MDFNIIYRRKDGGIQSIISYKDSNGKWRQKSKQGFEDSRKGEKLAANWANDAITELKTNGIVNRDYENITFETFYRLFISDRTTTLRAHTLKGYNDSIQHFKALYNFKLKDINTMDIQREVNKLESLSSASIEVHLKRIKCIFNFAVNKYEIINKNPVKNIEYNITKPQEKTALTNRELETLLSKLKTLRTYKPYISSLLAAKCGLRIGEFCGLTWKDINFNNKSIDVNKQWIKDKNGIWGFGELKSQNSYRNVPMPKLVAKELLNLKQIHPTDISNRILKVKNTTAFSSDLIVIYKKFEFNISVHELRHTYATNLIANDIDFKTAAKFLGHDIKETMNTYSHVNDDMLKNAKNIIEKFF